MTEMSSATYVPPSKRRRCPLQHSFHVLTDGSEYTGPATVFLTVQPTSTLTIRYAISGLTGMGARLSADQKFSLHPTRAIFCPCFPVSLDGLASLLLTLAQAGASQVTVCGGVGTSNYTEHMAHSIIGKSAHPQVVTCEVDGGAGEWFHVYKDEYLVVHAQCCAASNDMVLVYTLQLDEEQVSFAVVPPGGEEVATLPAFVGLAPLDFVLTWNGTATKLKANRCLTMKSREWDDGLLVRAQHQARYRNDNWSFLYPYNHDSDNMTTLADSAEVVCMTSCTEWRLGDEKIDRDSWKQEIWQRCREKQENADEVALPFLALSDFHETFNVEADDENEIDLDDEDGSSANESPRAQAPLPTMAPHLLVLGTGCASPSPLRGSSGYAVFLPTRQGDLELKIVIECGEGFVTNLNRHMPMSSSASLDQQLHHIALIWISHGHLDHYGGLPCLLRARHEALSSIGNNDYRRCLPPIVVAPRKVLEFLKVALDDKQVSLFQGMTHAEWEASQSRHQNLPFDYVHSIPVNHCHESYGLLMSLHGSDEGNVLFCYSGDCRPSRNMINFCRKCQQRKSLTLLLHESTFDEEELAMARSKRHCTISEALDVAREIQPDACLLTHFSSRQSTAPTSFKTSTAPYKNYGLCQDGLWLPLTHKALANLHLLQK